MTLDFSSPRDVVFYKDTIEFTVYDDNFKYNGQRLVFDKNTQYVRVVGENEPLRFIENPNGLFSRDDWKEYVSPGAVDIKPTKDNGFLMMKGIIRHGNGVKDLSFYKDRIEFTDDHAGSNLCGERLRLYKETRKLVRIDIGEVISEKIPIGECDVLFGEGWKDRVDIPNTRKDMVDQPSHYRRYGMESIDAMKGTMSPEEFNGFLKGNAFKYLTRAGAKDALEQDLHKVCWYAMFLYLSNGGTVESLGKTFEYMEGRFSK